MGMGMFLQWIVPALILVVVLIATFFIPANQLVQVLAPLLVGVVMFTLKSFLGIPNITIKTKSSNITYVCIQEFSKDDKWIRFNTSLQIVNDSATGEGEISNLILKIFRNGKDIDVPVLRRKNDQDIIGFRFAPHSVFPEEIAFETTLRISDLNELQNKNAEIHLYAVGQGAKRYKFVLSK
jgi:hypothetical protein